MPKKYKDVRIVTFNEDYSSTAGKKTGEVIYRKGSKHAMHEAVAASIKRKGAKITVEKFDKEAAVKKLKAETKDAD